MRFIVAFLFTLLLNTSFHWVRAQSPKTCTDESNVEVGVFPLGPGNAVLQDKVTTSVRGILCSINIGIPDLTDVDISDLDIGILYTATTLHASYKVLLVPVVPTIDDIAYQVRGIHLNHSTIDNPQLALFLDRSGQIVKAEVVDDADREANWESASKEISERVPKGDEMLRLIQQLEDTYNQEAFEVAERGATSMNALAALLEEATIRVSILKNGVTESVSYSSYRSYIEGLVGLIQGAGSAPKVTFELVHIYPHRDTISKTGTGTYSEALRYRVTFIQHWMFEPGGYLDTDYVSLDIDVRPKLTIRARNAGRGSFTLDSNPSGIKISTFNGVDTWKAGIKTPLYDFISAPWQNHYATLEDTWYETRYIEVKPEEILNHTDVLVDMVHKEGLIDLTLLPNSDNVTVKIENDVGDLVDASLSENKIRISTNQLMGKPDVGGTITDEHATREIRLVIEKPFYQALDTTISLPGPDEFPVTIELKKKVGFLAVTSAPALSNVLVNGDFVGTTPLEAPVDITGDDGPAKVSVTNSICHPGPLTQDCVLHFSSEEKEARIQEGLISDLHFVLEPFVVRNLTKTASFNVKLNTSLQQDVVAVDVEVVDNYERNRPYVVEFQIQDLETGEELVDLSTYISQCTSEHGCLGRNIRPGSFSMEWYKAETLSKLPESAAPVLTLRRRSRCWACVVLPPVAGIAVAYLLPRTSTGDSPLFLPPPRPDGTP